MGTEVSGVMVLIRSDIFYRKMKSCSSHSRLFCINVCFSRPEINVVVNSLPINCLFNMI